MKINNHDALCIDWYRRLISDGTAEDGQRIAVQMYEEVKRLENLLKNKLEELESRCKGDEKETYTTGYHNGHRIGQIELIKQALNIADGCAESEATK